MRILLPLAALLLLAGCSPSTPSDEAWSACVNGEYAVWLAERPSASHTAKLEGMSEVAHECDRRFEADPGAFEEAYG